MDRKQIEAEPLDPDDRASESSSGVGDDRLRLAADAARLAYFDWNLVRGEVWCSRHLCALIGLGDGDQVITSQQWSECIHESHRSRYVDDVQRWAVEGGAFESEYRLTSAPGTTRWVQHRGSVIDQPAARERRLIGVTSDITSLRVARQELNRSRAEFDSLGRMIAGQLGATLGNIAEIFARLLREPGESMEPAIRDSLEQAVVDVATGRELVGGLAQLSTVDNEIDEIRPTSSQQAFERAVDQLRPIIRQRGAKIRGANLPEVEADHGQLTRLFRLLLTHSIRHHRDQPPEVEVDCEEWGGIQLFSVRDNYFGGEPRFGGALFHLDQQTEFDEELTRYGVELAVARRIVERFGGTIGVDAVPGMGTTFFFTLPASK